MTAASGPAPSYFRDALDLWAVRLLTAFSLRLSVRTFLGWFVGVTAFCAVLAAGLAFSVVSAVPAVQVVASSSPKSGLPPARPGDGPLYCSTSEKVICEA